MNILHLQSSSKSLPQSKMDSSWWKTTNQESIIACGTDVEETQVVEETSFPITLGDCKATEKFDVNQATQMYVEETQMYEDEAATVFEIPSLINKEQSEIKGKMMTVRESSSSVIAFSPQSASTQVFSSDAETSFLPTLLLETSDRLDTADDDDKLAPTLSPTTAISLSSENRVSLFLPNIKIVFFFYTRGAQPFYSKCRSLLFLVPSGAEDKLI